MRNLLSILLVILLCMSAACAEDVASGSDLTATPTPAQDNVFPPMSAKATPTPRPTEAPLPEDPFMANAVEIARRIGQLAQSERFMWYYDYSGATQEQIEAVAGGDHTMPARVFHISGEQLIVGLYSGAEAGAMLDFTRVELQRDLVSSLPEMLLGVREETELSLIYLLARYKTFACDTAAGCGLYIMLYEDATPIVLPWYAENGAVKISAFFMPDAALTACTDAAEVSAWFAGKGLPAVTFEEVQP